MKYQITLNTPVTLSSDDLATFLALAGVGATIEPIEEIDEVSTAKPRKKTATKKKTTTKESTAKESIAKESTTETSTTGLDRGVLLERFTSLVESDYDRALDALDAFGVSRFSEVPDEQLEAFAEAIQ